MKVNNSDNYESIKVLLTEEKFPIAFKNKLEELIGCGMAEDEARKWIETTPIELELYYEKDCGLFGVEAESVSSTPPYSPYTGIQMEEADED
jgi:hypothetical protein